MIAQVENLRSLCSEHRGCLLLSKLIQQRLEIRIFHCPPSHRLPTNLEGSFQHFKRVPGLSERATEYGQVVGNQGDFGKSVEDIEERVPGRLGFLKAVQYRRTINPGRGRSGAVSSRAVAM